MHYKIYVYIIYRSYKKRKKMLTKYIYIIYIISKRKKFWQIPSWGTPQPEEGGGEGGQVGEAPWLKMNITIVKTIFKAFWEPLLLKSRIRSIQNKLLSISTPPLPLRICSPLKINFNRPVSEITGTEDSSPAWSTKLLSTNLKTVWSYKYNSCWFDTNCNCAWFIQAFYIQQL